MNTRQHGGWGEQIAAAFLRLQGYEILEANARFARREVDLLARDGVSLVVVEVKLRRGCRFGSAVEAIDARKLSRLRLALAGFARDAGPELVPRIDVVTIDVDATGDRMTVEHYVGVY